MCPSTRRLAALALLFPACAGTGERPELLPPQVTLVDVAVLGVARDETTLALTMRFANENLLPLATLGGVYGVSLNGVRAGKALSNLAQEIPGPGEATQAVELRIDNELLQGELRSLRSATSLDYVIEAKLYLDPRHPERILTSSRSASLELSPDFASALARLAPDP